VRPEGRVSPDRHLSVRFSGMNLAPRPLPILLRMQASKVSRFLRSVASPSRRLP
jgi:hypothetical protein